MGELTRQFDWSTTTLGAPEQWPQSLRTTVSILLNSRFPMLLWWGKSLIQFYNDAYRPSLGNNGKHPGALGKAGELYWPETWPVIKPLIDQVLDGGEAVWSEDQLIPIYRNGRLDEAYWTFCYSPVKDESDQVAGVLVTCTETTNQLKMVSQLKLSEQRFQNLIREASVGIVVLTGLDMRVEVVNKAYAQLIDRTSEQLLGKPIFESIPEAEAVFGPIIKQVRQTGEPLYLYGHPYHIYTKDGIKEAFLNLTYQPYREQNGTITGVMVLCQDVTEQVMDRQKVEESRAQLAQSLNEQQKLIGILDVSNEFIGMTGLDGSVQYVNPAALRMLGWDTIEGKTIWDMLYEEDWGAARKILAELLHTGRTSYEFRFKNAKKGEPFWLQWNAVVNKNETTREVIGFATVSQDITQQRKVQQALLESEERYRRLSAHLELEVYERTSELASVNEELAAANEELATSNEELTESNELLMRSNNNLEQFAYVASHDLQEPLRKIQQFGDLLKDQCRAELGTGVMYLERMQSAAGRMSTLIRDLLSFSRISTGQASTVTVSLANVVETVLIDLDLRIQETGAVIEVDDLPTIQGDRSQLEQLFQNLLSNALKFRDAERRPQVGIWLQTVPINQLPLLVRPARTAKNYYRIDVADNGIGFDEKYVDRIFQVFQRLHGKSEFAGTGVGLAICQKVVANHGGDITATSRPGAGATFSVYLPVV
ncbi:PAS domain-containing sensor histidine kinase [Spirosoma fluviale]|uniref:histidine kinase n=1 Tax=Spirosoma fluviale TaxID=1597977 RepID=A0A286GN54_9BACT|nr:PAS domain S-box-containing protein [Spirosoma fluviale]